jgi:hypothetical protein
MITKASKVGRKENEIRALREEQAGDIPDFLRRTETAEEAEKRRAKYAPKDPSAGLKVKKPPEPLPPAIAKAIKKDLGEKKSGESTLSQLATVFSKPTERPRGHARLTNLAEDLPAAAREAQQDMAKAKSPKPKKVSSLIAKALKERDELLQKVKQVKPQEHDMTKKTQAKKKPEKLNVSAKKKNGKASSSARAEKAEQMVAAFKRKGGVTNADLARILGARPSASVMRKVCETRDLKLKIVKKEGEPTRYMI